MKKSVRKRVKSAASFIDDVVTALCADYERRKKAINDKSVPKRVRMEYIYINTRIFSAAAEMVGHYDAEKIINEIGSRIGYAKSEFDFVCELSYKVMKQKTRRRIAKALYLE